MKTAIIGAGAAGLCAAVKAAQLGQSVTLFERMDRVGKKLLATGNGRCNLMNTGPLCYPDGQVFAEKAFEVVSPKALWAFFESLGLNMREEAEGRVYPATGQAATVLNVLLEAMHRLEIAPLCGVKVERILPHEGGYIINGEWFHRVIIATGGRAQEKLGSDGSGLALLKALGHSVTPFSPSLTAMETDSALIKGLSGIRVKADIRLNNVQRSGEILFTDYGISGVCVMQLSAYYEKSATVSIDFRKAMNIQGETYSFLLARRAQLGATNVNRFLTGLFATPLCGLLLKRAETTDLRDEALLRLARLIENFELPVLKLKGFEQAQLSKGGAALHQFNPATMESNLFKGLYAVGELLDVAGDCGGFNLMFAFSSGIIAAQSA
jgi:flavoprotein, HI0933 family